MQVLNALRIATLTTAMMVVSGCNSLLPQLTDNTTTWTDRELYAEAQNALSAGDWSECSKHFKFLEERDLFGEFTQQAQINIAYCQWRDHKKTAARQAVNRFIELYPDHPNIAYAYYLTGLIEFNSNPDILNYFMGQNIVERDSKALHDSYNAFRVLIEKYPSSKYTLDAVQRMHCIVNILALNEVNKANYYYQRGAYIAAINRAQIVLKKYQNTTATEHALHIMILAYRALQQQKLADDSQRVLESTFPDSAYITNRIETLHKSIKPQH
ncbi:outer membrane protein assembly factor BamD [Candidatus Vallotiella sp. (ex Adelges kitamiensis)]|uniref:outer membrane protein assembly factor BamD n=1 Tax=Candidatus Vallotiella sp. (ex Adelges kitamiensis) TaxID=2864217 RepID=UPI001CE26BE1|nr:outer membrane protein assembly factor BamD [Candidatus Vallotia sp. (ex Adelges kitamiensis)]